MPKSPKKARRVPPETALVLRLCRADMTSHGGFTWPAKGPVEAPDWKQDDECGNGLHGWLWGVGEHGSCNYFAPDARWLVVQVARADIVDLGGKVKFPRGVVVHCGDQTSATAYLRANRPASIADPIIGETLTGGYASTLTGGARSTLTGGEDGILVIRYWDDKAHRWRLHVGYVGENGVEKGKPYHLADGKFVEGEHPEAAEISAKKPIDR